MKKLWSYVVRFIKFLGQYISVTTPEKAMVVNKKTKPRTKKTAPKKVKAKR